MKLNYKHAIALIALAFFFTAPALAAANEGGAVVAQDIGEDFLFELIENGAEVVYANINEQGEPIVIYGQLGVPDEALALNDPMYEGCIAMALVSTQGELLEYMLSMFGDEIFNISSAETGDFVATQFGEEGFDPNQIFEMLGTDFNLMFNVFFNLDAGTTASRMNAIKAHMNGEFGFSFSVLLDLRIDEEFIQSFVGNETEIDLPFESIHLYIHQVNNPFADAVDSILDVMDGTGFLGAIDRTVFSTARASGAGILAVPDMGDLINLIEGFTNETSPSPMSFVTSQMPDLDGPLAIVAAGYIGDQILSTDSDELDVFEDLLGKSPAATIDPLTEGQSLVILDAPSNMNITSYTPEDEALNLTHYDNSSNMVFWNATAYSAQSDYSVYFTAGDFPPLVSVERTFAPDTTTPGGSTVVTVTVTNHGDDPIYNVTIDDEGIDTTYPSVSVTGTTSTQTAILAGGAQLNMTYTVTFANEGGYTFGKAEVTYEYGSDTYYKSTYVDGYIVSADPVGLLSDMISDGWPYTGVAIGVVGLGAVLNIVLMVRSGGGKSYQV